ncbi:nucleoporin NDC1 [Ixodes scapularis]
MSASAKEWFRNEVYFWRCLHFAKNLLLLQALLTPVALIVLQFSVWHPLQGPYQWLTSYMTASTLWYHLLSIMATLVLSLYHIANVEDKPASWRCGAGAAKMEKLARARPPQRPQRLAAGLC